MSVKESLKKFFCWEHEYFNTETHYLYTIMYDNKKEIASIVKDFDEFSNYLHTAFPKDREIIYYDGWNPLPLYYKSAVCPKCGDIINGKELLYKNLISFAKHWRKVKDKEIKAQEIYKKYKE